MIISNAFSFGMLDAFPVAIEVEEVTLNQAADLASREKIVSCINHEPMARVFSDMLGVPISPDRQAIALKPGDRFLIGQYKGPRLQDSDRTLPEGAKIKWLLASVYGWD